LTYGRVFLVRLSRALLKAVRLSEARIERIIVRLDALIMGFEVLRDGRRFTGAVLWSLFAWFLASVGTWFMLRAFLPSAGWTMSFIVLTVVALGAAVPSAPGALGLFEATVVYVLSMFAVERELALSFGLTFHISQFVLTAIMGGLALAREGETFGHLARSAQALVTRTEKPATPTA
jgi:uncharacterized protein (TIRG00374 family)